MRNKNKFMFFAVFHRIIYSIPLILLLIFFLWVFPFNYLVYLFGILGMAYLLFFIVKDVFLKEKELQTILG
jgi:hypothetical protein